MLSFVIRGAMLRTITSWTHIPVKFEIAIPTPLLLDGSFTCVDFGGSETRTMPYFSVLRGYRHLGKQKVVQIKLDANTWLGDCSRDDRQRNFALRYRPNWNSAAQLFCGRASFPELCASYLLFFSPATTTLYGAEAPLSFILNVAVIAACVLYEQPARWFIDNHFYIF